jgi:DNA-binding transcriptional MerR regulator
LIYCRAGLVQPVFQPPYGVITFSEEAVLLIRRIERVRTARGIDMAWIRQMFELLEELNRLRSEVRFLRQNG